jgi:hypothetical protein
MATTSTKTSTRTKVLAAVGVVAALGLIGWAAAIIVMKKPVQIKPDLTISVTPPSSSIEYLSTGVITTVVTNDGSTTAKNVGILIQAGPNGFYDEDYIKSAGVTVTSGSATCSLDSTSPNRMICSTDLAAKGSVTIEWEVQNVSAEVINCAETEAVYLGAYVDYDTSINESNETNNHDTVAAGMDLTGPTGSDCEDLTARLSAKDGIEEITAGDDLDLTLSLENKAGIDHSGVSVLLDTPTSLSMSLDGGGMSCSVTGSGDNVCKVDLAAGDDNSYTFYTSTSSTIVDCDTTETFTFEATVDELEAVEERDEDDNTDQAEVTITGLPCKP